MGQNICGNQIESQQRITGQTLEGDFEITVDDGGDNPSKHVLQNKFLQTEVIASWNILKEKPLDFMNIGNIFHDLMDSTKKHNQSINNLHNSNKQTELQIKNDEIITNFNKKKFRTKVPSTYQNIEIDVSSFINIRTQNINSYYEFKEKIGEGTFGNVYRGVQKRTGQVRAIKGLKKQAMNNISKMSLIAEIELLKKLDHPNIIKLYDLFLHDGHYYVVTQFCEGGCVQKYFSKYKNQINEETARILMKQLFSTLNYLYNNNIVHRDLKLQNLVFFKYPSKGNENLQIKLIDFGTAARIQKHKKYQSGLVGTLNYIAPQYTKGFFTQKCDIWSAGVIFYQLLFGQYPFRGKKQSDILNQITTKIIDWKKVNKNKISNQALQLIQTMLDKNYLTRASAKSLIQNEWILGACVARASKELQQSVSSSLARYNRKNNFVSLIESFLTFKKVTQVERQQLSRLFCQIDNDNSGIIEIDELITFYKKNFPQYKEEQIVEIVSNVDKNNSGKIDFNEFLTAVAEKNNLYAEEALRDVYDYIDKDKTGYVSKKEIKELLNMADKRQVQEVFKHLDENGDNQISFQQFKSYLINLQ